jgi:hypothetical protein
MPTSIPNRPHPSDIGNVGALVRRLNLDRSRTPDQFVSVEERDVPQWQRGIVWKEEDMGLLAYSIVRGYPIGLIVLWRKTPGGIRVPIDGRQRLTAVRAFAAGQVVIPDHPGIPPRYRNRKYVIPPGEEEGEHSLLEVEDRDYFDEYQPRIDEYDGINERDAMDIFVRLQGGKPLLKQEVRAALGGQLCDFVTELTRESRPSPDDEEEEAVESDDQHPFFRRLNVRAGRKKLRNVCDMLFHEFLHPGENKHWSALQEMYYEKANLLPDRTKEEFRRALSRFLRAITIRVDSEERPLPQLRTEYLILTVFQVWRDLSTEYALPRGFEFARAVETFETKREMNPDEDPWIKFTSALSNAGYAQERMATRYRILMAYMLENYGPLALKDPTRAFTEAQKLAIWTRAGHRCEHEETGERCVERFPDFQRADADHFVKWSEGGPTTIENGRLLCRHHNRGRRDEPGLRAGSRAD